MSQTHNIIKSFNEKILSDATVSGRLPGGLHQGIRTDESTPRPYGVIQCTEESREYHSGFGSLAKYKVVLTVYNKDRVGTTGQTQNELAGLFDLAFSLPSVIGTIMSIVPIAGEIKEDENDVQGKDVLTSQNTWAILINEGTQ